MFHKLASTDTDLAVEVAATYETKHVPLSEIKVPHDHKRPVQPALVDEIAESFQKVGQKHPIFVQRVAGAVHTCWLVSGLPDLEAARKLGWDTILASVVEEIHAHRLRLAEAVENLIHVELGKAEPAWHQNEASKKPAHVDAATLETDRSRATGGRESKPRSDITVSTTLDRGLQLALPDEVPPPGLQAQLLAPAKPPSSSARVTCVGAAFAGATSRAPSASESGSVKSPPFVLKGRPLWRVDHVEAYEATRVRGRASS